MVDRLFGFYYKHWREKFYPKGLPQRKWFEFYCESFNTVELNVTFYRYPKLEALQGWAEAIRNAREICAMVKKRG